ncbi:hypothetical protein CWE15_03120 [Aliidiomarina taiwanensis]|uniref:Uncharacterized protein n=1 Tax=Aliidiomarina taiwanensis TaxID=946228 RepID=A0A432X9T0_9GAMM|nr:hypothetical protein [Aliidiomarina taiwanensis]RUO44172.1 hypothetical protein CWE15_03120 [Aliidiomarina taiwanensis]
MSDMWKNQQIQRIGGHPSTALDDTYTLDTKEVLKEAWDMVRTTKAPFLMATFIIYVIALASSFVFPALDIDVNDPNALDAITLPVVLGQFALQVITAILFAGMISMGLRNAVRGQRAENGARAIAPNNTPMMVFEHFPTAWPLVVFELIKAVAVLALAALGLLLANNLGVSLNALMFLWIFIAMTFSLGLIFSVQLIIQDKLSPVKAIRVSLTVVFRRFFTFLPLYAFMTLLAVASVFTFFIGFIWVIPLFFNMKGILYREIFGIEAPVTNGEDS